MAKTEKRLINRYGGWFLILLVLLAVAAIFWVVRSLNPQLTPTKEGPIPVKTPISASTEISTTPTVSGFTILLSDGQAHPQMAEPLPIATGEPLSAGEVANILSRLPTLTPDAGDQVDFHLPEQSLPAPRTGKTIDEVFPLPPEVAATDVVEDGPLEVLRYSPEGEVPIAPFISITFNQPMVPLGTLEDLAAKDVPVTIEPSLPGTWRWLGTKTLTFQYDSVLFDRLPMATEYRVTIPAGTTSAIGGVLADELQFTFNTPPPTLQSYFPTSYEPQPLDPVFLVVFDQRVDPGAVLETIQVTADFKPVSVRLATSQEIEADEMVSRMAGDALDDRWLAFTATQPLPADASIQVTIGPDTPSREGPLLTTEAQTFDFRTYAPLQITDHGCSGWGNSKCHPLEPFFIQFNNPLDADVFNENMLQIEPAIPGANINIFGNTISVSGATEGQTTYQLTVRANLQDAFGQTLGKDQTLSIRVGSAEPFLVGPDKIFVTLDPAADKPSLPVYVMNYSRLDVQIYSVEPADWPAFKTYLSEYQRTDKPASPPGKLVRDVTMRLDTPSDKLTEIDIDLSKELKGESGQFIVIAKPPRGLFKEERYWEHVQVWVQVSQIGLDATLDYSQMLVWATALEDGSPLSDVDILSSSGKKLSATGADGLARFDIPRGASYLLARQGKAQAMLPSSAQYYWDDKGWIPQNPQDELRWYVFDDRQMYRPGEEVHVKGWVRRVGGRQDGDVGLPGVNLSEISYRIIDPQGNDLGSGNAEPNAWGGFDFSFTLPENANLGNASVSLSARAIGVESSYSHEFQIQEFRRPEFEVAARNETKAPYFVGDSATVAVEAKYYAGGPLPNADVYWLVSSAPTNYNPPNWPTFTFGIWQPWWWFDYQVGGRDTDGGYQEFNGKTDVTGNHFLKMDFEKSDTMRPFSVTAESTVTDVNRQAWTGSTSLLVHPADLYVGLHSERYFVERGQPLEIELIVTDLDGNPVAGRKIQISAARLEWKYEAGEWVQKQVDPQECEVDSGDEPVHCNFETFIGGRYQIAAIVSDESGRRNKSQITRWVSGAERPPSRQVEKEEVTLVPDKDNYQPGETAKILVEAPFSPAEGLLTVSRSGLLYTERFTIEGGSTTLEVPIREQYVPNLNVQVDLVGAAARTDDHGNPLANVPDRPAYASGTLNLPIPPLQRTLDLNVAPRQSKLEPGGETTLDVTLKSAGGQPVSDAELAVVVVDESILALTNYQLTDPISVFYTNRPSGVQNIYGRASIVLADPLSLQKAAESGAAQAATDALKSEASRGMTFAAPAATGAPAAEAPMEELAADEAGMAVGGNAAAANTPIRVRLDFNPLALFAPDVHTDADGKASLTINLPDNLTRYRIMVVAVDQGGRQFGSGEANLTARLPLMVRPSAPRFLNFGDSFELPVVLQNQTDEPMDVDVAVRATNIGFTDATGLRVSVPANDRVEVRFPASTEMAGTARFQIAAVSGVYADAATVDLPVYTPATTEVFATYGVVDDGAVIQPVASPQGVYPQFGGLEVQTSSTALQALTDAVIYLVSYPFECSEQLSSRILGVASLRDVLTAFEAEELPTPAEMESAVDRDIERLRGMQNYDGGFPYWRRGQESVPFNTIHVAHALQRAKLKGFDVPADMQENALYYLRDIESHYPSWYSQNTRWTLSAYALYVRNLVGDSDPAKARQLLDEAGLENLSLDALGWVWQVLIDDPNSGPELDAIHRYVGNRVVETAGAANFTTDYDEQNYLLLGSNRRTDAILLDAMMADNPDSDLIPKLVNGLLAHRTQGRWGNTQENVFVLLALDRYFNTYEAQTPDFVARIWLGDTYAGEHIYEGRTTEQHETNIPMSYLVPGGDAIDAAQGGGQAQNLVISKTGPGRLYYRLSLSYAPTNLQLDPLDMGFVVQREYEAIDDPSDVARAVDGTWHIKAGARVRVRLTMVADNRRYHVALVDPLPAGLEIVNPSLAVSGSVPQDPNGSNYRYGWWWWGTWYEHQNMRDDRAEAFASLLWDGVYEYSYVARATTPGAFIVPPAKAEEMYSPEVFGRSASDKVIVE